MWGIVAGHVLSGEDNISAIEQILKRELNLTKQNYSFYELLKFLKNEKAYKSKFENDGFNELLCQVEDFLIKNKKSSI